jgi:hypothetical protein
MNPEKITKTSNDVRIVFLHHSTGAHIWKGKQSTPLSGIVRRFSNRLANKFHRRPALPELFRKYNNNLNVNYVIDELVFPKKSPYGWNNYPYDYFNIWVKNAGNNLYMQEPTLEILTRKYQVIIFKHCFPVSNIQPDQAIPDINSDFKSIVNYKLQYNALRKKLAEFPNTKFILFTGVAQVRSQISEDEAIRARKFFEWVMNDWNLPDSNIYLWDLYNLQTERGIYFKDSYASSESDSHPNEAFSQHAAELLFSRIIDIIETNGKETALTGEKLEFSS